MSWPPSSVGNQTKDAFAKDRFVIIGDDTAPLDRGGLGANLRTPSDLFTNNKDIRVIAGNDTDARDYSENTSDLEFDQDGGGEGNVDASGDKFPKYLYLGVVAAGGPCGGAIICANTQLSGGGDDGAQPTCPGAISGTNDSQQGLYICPTYRNYSLSNIGSNNPGTVWPAFTSLSNYVPLGLQGQGDTTTAQSLNTIFPSGVPKPSESGKKVGVFLKACEGSVIGTSSARKTLIVRLVKLGKGGVESFDTRDVITLDDNGNRQYNLGINKTSTTFPPKIRRDTEIEVYEYTEDGTTLSWENHGVLSIKCEGGRARPTNRAFQPLRNCNEVRERKCSQCAYIPVQSDPVDAYTIRCLGWSIPDPPLVDEVSSNPSIIGLPPKVVPSSGYS